MFLALWTSPKSSSQHGSFITKKKKKQEEPERGRVSKTEITIFYNLISEMTSYLFAAFYLLETSHWVQSTLEGSMKAQEYES